MSIAFRFKSKCHALYDNLHGQSTISRLFDNISDKQVEDLIVVYKRDVLGRWNNIETFLKNEKLDAEHNDDFRVTGFYLNAIQHFTEKN